MNDIIKAYAVKNLCYIAGEKMTPKGIVVHSTGANNPNLKRYVDSPAEVGANPYNNHWNVPKPGGQKVCVHAFIGYDKESKVRVAEILPLNICCWGVGKGAKGSYNYDPAYIQFEICEDDLKNKNYYNEAFDTAAEYCALLCEKYGIQTENIVGHFEAHKRGYGSNHSDPEHWMKNFGDNMDNFRKRVADILKKNKNAALKNEVKSGNTEIKKGDLVRISENAVYYNNKPIPEWVKKQNWYVKEISNDKRAVIDKNESGTNSIMSPINKDYLILVKSGSPGTTPVENTAKNNLPYTVKIVSKGLNIRKGAGTDTAKVGRIDDMGVYTIVEEKNGPGALKWGKLKSGAGWISLDYTKKL